MVVNGANKPNLLKDLAIIAITKGLMTSSSSIDKMTTAGKRYTERSYNQKMKKAAGEHYHAKQEAEDEQ